MTRTLSIFLLFILCSSSSFSQKGEQLFSDTIIHEIRFEFDTNNFWNILTTNYQNSIDPITGVATDTPYLPGTFSFDGEVIENVGLRQKGFSSYFASNESKKSLKVDLNEFVAGQHFDGIKKFNLANGVGDPSMQRDIVCYNMMREAGIKAPRTALTRVYLNDEYWGVYVIIEQVDPTFIQNNFASGTGNLFKNIGWSDLAYLGENPDSYKQAIALKTNEEEDDWTDFIELVRVIHQSTPANFQEEIEKVFNVDYFLRVLAIDIMTDNWDSYLDHGRNYYLYHEPTSDQFFWIPWDYNLSMGGQFGNESFDLGFNDPPEDPTSCPTILDGSCPYPPTDSIFLEVVGTYNFCCYGQWDFLCQQLYDDIEAGVTPADCNTIINGSCPHSPDDEAFQIVSLFSPNCCDDTWNDDCEFFFQDIKELIQGGVSYIDFDLLYVNPSKKLIQKIFGVPEYRERYLNYACDILDGNFDSDRLSTIVDLNGDLLYESVQAESFPNFPFDDFEYDISEGIDSSNRAIPAVKQFINHRIPVLNQNLDDLQHECQTIVSSIDWQEVVINEFVAANDSTSNIADQDGEFEDWIELYNNTDETVDLKDFYLSDNYDNPQKWSFPPGASIAPNGYLIIWADENGSEDGLHANFKLNREGEHIMLVHEDGTFIDSLSFGPQETNVPLARVPNGTGDFINQHPTFNGNNDVSSVGEIAGTSFRIFPNPSNELINISLDKSQAETVSFQLFNAMGHNVSKKHLLTNDEFQLDVSDYPKGIYFGKIEQENYTAITKIVIQ